MTTYGQDQVSLIQDMIAAGQTTLAKMGTVASRETASALATVSFDGSSGLAQPVKCFDSVIVDVGDRVGMVKFEGEWIIVGNYTMRTLADEMTSVQYAGTNTTTSASFVDMPAGASLTLFKVKDATQLQITIACSMQATVANTTFTVGVHIGNGDLTISTDVTVMARAFNTASQHQDWTGSITTNLTLPSDSYTVTGRWLRRGGTGSLSMNVDDGVWLHVKEVLS